MDTEMVTATATRHDWRLLYALILGALQDETELKGRISSSLLPMLSRVAESEDLDTIAERIKRRCAA